MDVKQSTVLQSVNDIPKEPVVDTPPAPAEPTNSQPDIVVPTPAEPIVTTTVIPTPSEPSAPVPVIAPAATPAPEVDEVIAFDFPEFPDPQAILNNDIPTPITQPISWRDAVKDVPEDELAELLGDDDFIKGMRKHIKNGGAPIDYIAAKGVDWKAVSDTDLLKGELRNQFPNATPTQIDRLFNKKYSQTEIAEEEDKEDGLLLMGADARKVREQKIEQQQKFKIADARPLPQQTQIQEPQIDPEKQARLEKDSAYIVNHDATKNLFQSKRVAIEIAEGVKQNMGISNPQALMDIWFKPGILEKYTRTPQGEPDVQLLQEAALFIANRTAFKKQIYNAGRESAIQSVVSEGQNAGKQGTVLPLNPSNASITEAFNNGITVSTIGKLASK